MADTKYLWLGLVLVIGCGSEIPADGGMQRIDLNNKAHKPIVQPDQGIANIGDQTASKMNAGNAGNGGNAGMQDFHKPVDQKGLDSGPLKPDGLAREPGKLEVPAKGVDASKVEVKQSVVSDTAVAKPASAAGGP